MSIESNLTKEMTEAILNVMNEFGSLKKTETNQHGRYNFAPVDDFYDRAARLFPKYGLLITSDEIESELIPMTVSSTDKNGNTIGGKTTIWIKTKWVFNIHHNGVTSRDFTRYVFVPTSGPQTEGIAQSYASKNFLRELFKIRTGEYELDDMPPTEHGVPEKQNKKSSVPHDPETGEVVDTKAVLDALYNRLVADDFKQSDVQLAQDTIDKRYAGGKLTKVHKEALNKVLHARKMIFGTNTIEELERSREAVDAVPTVFRDDLEKFLETRKKEVVSTVPLKNAKDMAGE